MRQSKYPLLNSLAALLGKTAVLTCLSAEEKQKAKDAADPCKRVIKKNVTETIGSRGGNSSLYVKLSLGQLITLGYIYRDTSLDAWEKVLRFADMARMRFWKYRMRGAIEPTDADLNFSVARANEDLKCETHLCALLDREEAMMLQLGLIASAEEMAKRRADLLKNRSHSKTAEGLNRLETRIEALYQKLDGFIETGVKQSISSTANGMKLEKEIAELKGVMNTLAEGMNAVLTSITRLNESPTNPPLKGVLKS